MTLSLKRLIPGMVVVATMSALPALALPAQATSPVASSSVSSTTAAPAPAAKAYSRAQKLKRVDSLMRGSLSGFTTAKNRSHTGVDATLDWNDNGCSAPWWTGTAAYSKKFDKACNRHDFGYRNLGHGYYSKGLALAANAGAKNAVDSIFLADMRRICGSSSGCLTVAQGYYGAVRKVGTAQTAFFAKECQPGLLCLFDDTGYEDRRIALTSSEDDMNDVSFGDKTSSVKNTSSVAWRLYDDDGYSDTSRCVKPGQTISTLGGFGDKTSSAKKLSSSSC